MKITARPARCVVPNKINSGPSIFSSKLFLKSIELASGDNYSIFKINLHRKKKLSRDCLLLNGNGKPVSFFPLSVINWKTAVKLLLARNVILIKAHDDQYVRSPSISIELPSILMLKRFHKFHNYVKFSRSNVFLRDMYTCQYCQNIFSRNELTLDHVIPKSKNGLTNWENVVTSCKSCNSAKGSSLQKPIREPFKPSFSHLLNGHKIDEDTFPDSEWAKYIF